jgi:hypothetical protein
MDLSKEPVREGVRGGREQFRWDTLKTQSHRDRQQYLGYTTKLGVAGRFGKYDTNDWWRSNKSDSQDRHLLQEEKADLKRMEEELMMEALGIKPKRLLVSKHQTVPDRPAGSIKSENAHIPHATKNAVVENVEEVESRALTGLGYRKYLKPTDWAETEEIEETLEAKGEELLEITDFKCETQVISQNQRMFGPTRSDSGQIKIEESTTENESREPARGSREPRERDERRGPRWGEIPSRPSRRRASQSRDRSRSREARRYDRYR